MKTSLQVLRCLSVVVFLAAGRASTQHHFSTHAPPHVAMTTIQSTSDWHQEGSGSGQWPRGPANTLLPTPAGPRAVQVTEAPSGAGSARGDALGLLTDAPGLLPAALVRQDMRLSQVRHSITTRQVDSHLVEPPTGELRLEPEVPTSVQTQTDKTSVSTSAPELQTLTVVPDNQTSANQTGSDPSSPPGGAAENVTAAADWLLNATWTSSSSGHQDTDPPSTASRDFLNRQDPASTLAPWTPHNSSGPTLDPPPSRLTFCLSGMDLVWIVLTTSVAVSSCSVLLTVCCLKRRRKSSGQENLSYWNNAITMDYFSRHAVELPKEIHTLESEDLDSCLPPNGDYGGSSVVLVNPFCQESLFINREKSCV